MYCIDNIPCPLYPPVPQPLKVEGFAGCSLHGSQVLLMPLCRNKTIISSPPIEVRPLAVLS